jgi:hypothetical protein
VAEKVDAADDQRDRYDPCKVTIGTQPEKASPKQILAPSIEDLNMIYIIK